MSIHLNHTIVSVRDRKRSATFLSALFGLPAPRLLGPFAVVQVGDTSLDYMDAGDDDIAPQHYAFLVDDDEFDTIFGRVRERGMTYWADPMRQQAGEINHWDDGRGVYFDDPDGHLLEIITRPYGSGGTTAKHPHPLIAPPVAGDADEHGPG